MGEPENSKSMIRYDGVWKSFGPKLVFRDLNLDIQEGEVFTLIGKSGSGKSVALKMLVGLLRPDLGKIYFRGQDVSELTEEQFLPVRRKVSMLFQSAALFDSLNVYENVAYPIREHLKLDEDEVARRVKEKLAAVDLSGTEKLMPSELSGGMRKRIGLARALAQEPEVLLYDEPTTGLDPVNTRRINDLIVDLNKRMKMTSVVVTHDMASAFTISHRIGLLMNHCIAKVGEVEEFKDLKDEAIRNFVQGISAGEPESHFRQGAYA